MKRFYTLILILAAMVAGSGAASAQFRLAGIAGANISDLNFKQDLVTITSQPGFTAGVQGEMMFPGIGFGIDLGLMYNQLGAKVNLGEKKIWNTLKYGEENVMLHYLQIPFHLRFKWTRMQGLEEKIAPFVYGGPDLTFLMAHSNASAFKCAGSELGLTAGFGFEILQKWQVSASYTWGMTYALKTKLLDDYSARNRCWMFRVAYFFK